MVYIMLKILFGIIGAICLLPLAIVLVGLLIATLIGAYGYLVIQIAWPVAVAVLAIMLVKTILKLFKK
jgi:hypothetical protein